ncbi:MAG: ferritin-like domain-containing protein [Pseudobdellovibrionaceae bacterium]
MTKTVDFIPDRVFQVWNNRLKIEIEAANLFGRLGANMKILWGANDPIAELALTAADEELRHAELCREILKLSPKPIQALSPEIKLHLGPRNLDLQDHVLYTSVALGCVTETMSTALLLRMHQCADSGIFKDTIHEILQDEINHSRIGWAELARYQQKRNLEWLLPHIQLMINDSLKTEIKPMTEIQPMKQDLSSWGILPHEEAKRISMQTINEVLCPGLNQILNNPLKSETNV